MINKQIKMFSKIFISFFILLIFSLNVYAEQERYVLKDRDIKKVGILPFKHKNIELSKKIRDKFLKTLSQNKSNIEFLNIEEVNKNVDCVLTGELNEYKSEVKSNTIADAYNYDILEQQVKIAIDIEIRDTENNDLIWRRKSSKYNTQSWLDFVRSRIGDNNVIDYFYVPNQLSTGLKKQYNEEEFVDKTMNDVVKDLSFNLVKLK